MRSLLSLARLGCSLPRPSLLLSKQTFSPTFVPSASLATENKTPVKVDFYYDTISPYSWVAFEMLLRYQKSWNLDINYEPVLIGNLAKSINSQYMQGLKGHPNKVNNMFEDMERIGAFAKIPYRSPESLFYMLCVVGSSKQQHFLTAVKVLYPEYLAAVSREIWFRGWSEDMDIAKPSSLCIIGRRAGLLQEESENCLKAMETGKIKNLLKETTERAVVDGAPGLPYMLVHKEGQEPEAYYGSDRFEIMAHRFGFKYEGPIPEPDNVVEMEMGPDQRELFLKLAEFDEVNSKQPKSEKKIDPVTLL